MKFSLGVAKTAFRKANDFCMYAEVIFYNGRRFLHKYRNCRLFFITNVVFEKILNVMKCFM